MTESNRIEYKQKLTDNFEKEVIAFLNYKEGGYIYLGIDKHGNTVGVENIDEVQLKIKDRLKTNIQPSCMGLFDIVSEQKHGKKIIKITVASGLEKPYYHKKYGMTEKGCFMRVGSASEPIPIKIIEELFANRTRNSIGKITANRQDLTFSQLKIYYDEVGLEIGEKFAHNLELLTKTNEYNYVAYLMADNNATSIKVAKYEGTDRVDLIENNEYGYCSLIKATKNVLDKLNLENKTASKITYKERKDTRMWNPIALREAVINAIVHNNFTNEVPPKFEIFADRLEITSTGGLVNGLDKEEFFKGYSIPVNKEIMRIYKDLEMVEHLGSGVPRILKYYPESCFEFTDNFLRMVFPVDNQFVIKKTEQDTLQVTPQDTPQVTLQVKKLIQVITGEMSREEIQTKLNLSDKKNYVENYQNPAIKQGLIEMTIPNKPTSRLQKYRLTDLGKAITQKGF